MYKIIDAFLNKESHHIHKCEAAIRYKRAPCAAVNKPGEAEAEAEAAASSAKSAEGHYH